MEAKGSTMVAQGRQKHCSNSYTTYATVCVFYGTINGRSSICNDGDVYAFLLPPLSDLWVGVTDLLCDLCATVLNMLKISQWSCHPCWGLNDHPWTTKRAFRPSLSLQQRPDQCCGRTRETQRSQLLCKVGISNWPDVVLPETRVRNSVPAWNVSFWLLWRVRCD